MRHYLSVLGLNNNNNFTINGRIIYLDKNNINIIFNFLLISNNFSKYGDCVKILT